MNKLITILQGMDPKHFAQILHAIMTTRDLSVTETSNRTGISVATINRILNGETSTPRSATMNKLVKGLGLNVSIASSIDLTDTTSEEVFNELLHRIHNPEVEATTDLTTPLEEAIEPGSGLIETTQDIEEEAKHFSRATYRNMLADELVGHTTSISMFVRTQGESDSHFSQSFDNLSEALAEMAMRNSNPVEDAEYFVAEMKTTIAPDVTYFTEPGGLIARLPFVPF